MIDQEPVILVHLSDDQNPNWAACCGLEWKPVSSAAWPHVPRRMCPACFRLVTRG